MKVAVFGIYYTAMLLWGIGAWLALRHELHMFQQSGYKPLTFARRTFEKPISLLPYLVSLAIFAAAEVALELGFRYFGIALYGVSAAVLGYFRIPKPAKKPLVWTARVKRMTVTAVILLAAGLFIPHKPSEPLHELSFRIVGGLTIVMPLVVVLANVINSPIEKAINRHYINDAKRILAGMPNLTIVGVTGSYGKTSVKNYLAALLGAKYNTLATPENYNTTLGVVRTVRENLKPIHEIFVCEMGARHVGDIKEICELVHPQHGIITAVGEQHLETFGSQENIRKTKYELADAVPEGGKLFVNLDSAAIAASLPSHEHETYGLGDGCGWRGEVLSVTRRGTSFRVTTPTGETYEFETPLIGAANVQNLVGAIAVAHSLGVPLEAMRKPLRRLEPVEHRMQLLPRGPITIIDDAYNSNPAGAAAALETLGLFEAQKILVTPGMVELGARESELNREFGALAAKHCDAVALVGEAHTRPIREGLVGAGFAEEKIFVADTLDKAMAWVYALPGAEKVVLLENDLPDNY